ncbi:transposase [Patescibacteria group bacterium]|nr:transposase [Patescibacteria group bacterium]
MTSTISGHRIIFDRDNYATIVIDSLKYLREKRYMKLYSFVLMPNHIHILLKAIDGSTINEIAQKLHSYTGHALLAQMRNEKDWGLLKYFKEFAYYSKNDRSHCFWYDALVRSIVDERSVFRFMEYIHSNPFNKKCELVKDRSEYKYSSACYYDSGIQSIIEVDDVREEC